MWLQLLWVLAMIVEAVMVEGCPHCQDGIPKIVAWHHVDLPEATNFVGEWPEDLKAACLKFGQMRIISCRSIEGEIGVHD